MAYKRKTTDEFEIWIKYKNGSSAEKSHYTSKEECEKYLKTYKENYPDSKVYIKTIRVPKLVGIKLPKKKLIPSSAISEFSINRGGCGIAAILIADKLNLSHFAWASSWDKFSNKIAPTHVLAVNGDDYIDVGGTFSREQVEYHDGRVRIVDRKFIVSCIKYAKWNSCFDRRDVARIAKLMKVEIAPDLKDAVEYQKAARW